MPVSSATSSKRVTPLVDRPAAAAFIPPSPLAPGHTVVVPRRHVVDMFAAEDEDLAATMRLAREVATALRDVAGAQGVNLLHASGMFATPVAAGPVLRVATDAEVDEDLVAGWIDQQGR
jgi:diadenosine tetraphosphate (Ap4A) HIT family hydrolase